MNVFIAPKLCAMDDNLARVANPLEFIIGAKTVYDAYRNGEYPYSGLPTTFAEYCENILFVAKLGDGKYIIFKHSIDRKCFVDIHAPGIFIRPAKFETLCSLGLFLGMERIEIIAPHSAIAKFLLLCGFSKIGGANEHRYAANIRWPEPGVEK